MGFRASFKFHFCSFCYKTLILAPRRSGSFPEQSNPMNERSVTWRQTNRITIIYNRKQDEKLLHYWSYEKIPVTEVTGSSTAGTKAERACVTAGDTAFIRYLIKHTFFCYNNINKWGRQIHLTTHLEASGILQKL